MLRKNYHNIRINFKCTYFPGEMILKIHDLLFKLIVSKIKYLMIESKKII